MMPDKLQRWLEARGVRLARRARRDFDERDVAATMLVDVDGRRAMVVAPAADRIDFAHLAEVLGAYEVAPHGGLPEPSGLLSVPFGTLFDVPVYVATSLTEGGTLAFAVDADTVLTMRLVDWFRLVHPIAIDCSTPRERSATA